MLPIVEEIRASEDVDAEPVAPAFCVELVAAAEAPDIDAVILTSKG